MLVLAVIFGCCLYILVALGYIATVQRFDKSSVIDGLFWPPLAAIVLGQAIAEAKDRYRKTQFLPNVSRSISRTEQLLTLARDQADFCAGKRKTAPSELEWRSAIKLTEL